MARGALSLLSCSFVVLSCSRPTLAQGALDSIVEGPGTIDVSFSNQSETSTPQGWSYTAQLAINDAEVAWISDLTAQTFPVVPLAELGFGDVSPDGIDDIRFAVATAYGLQYPDAQLIFVVGNDEIGTSATSYIASAAANRPKEMRSEAQCGVTGTVSLTVSPLDGVAGDFAFGVRFRGNRFRRHVCWSVINSVGAKTTHGWLSFYAAGDPKNYGFYPRQSGTWYGEQGALKEEPDPFVFLDWDARVCFTVTPTQWQAMMVAITQVHQERPVYNLTGLMTPAPTLSYNCMDFARFVLAAAGIELNPQLYISSITFPPSINLLTSDPIRFGRSLELIGNAGFVGCGRVDVPPGRIAAPSVATVFDAAPEQLVVAASVPLAQQPLFWPPQLPISTLTGAAPTQVFVAPNSLVRLTVNSSMAGAVVTGYNGNDFLAIVQPGQTIEMPIGDLPELLAGGVVSNGGVQTYNYVFIPLARSANRTHDIVLNAPSLPPVMPVVEQDELSLTPLSDCIYDCDGDGQLDCDSEPDCNANGVPDMCDILIGISLDMNSDGIPDDCGSCSLADVTADGVCTPGSGNGVVNLTDFACYLTLWALEDPLADLTTDGECTPGSANGLVNLTDFACYLTLWEAGCP